MSHKTEVFLTIPKICDLVCVNCIVNPSDIKDPLIKSLFHCQILTCRLIIYTVRCCVAAPSIQNIEDSIHVIVSKEFYFTGKLQEHLQNLKVKFTDPEPVHPKIYEACLKYTLTFKLAPHWNAVGKTYYIYGFNFLSLPINAAALQWNILIKDNNARLEIIPTKLNLSPLHLESLSLPSSVLDYFLNSSNCDINTIDLSLFQVSSVFVLPKLTKARIVSVSKTIPKGSLFESYDDLRRHWKNMYSYRLPKSDEGILFYEVVFPVNLDKCFTYPEMCILSKIPETLMCESKNEIASEFIKDLTTNVHSICGQVIHIGHSFPEIDIEYSCTFKKKSKESNKMISHGLTSPFFKTPCLTSKTSNEKLNLSSLFTQDRLNKMRSPMRNHTQKILSIMGNHKKKKISINDQYNQFPPQMITSTKEKNTRRKYTPIKPGSPLTFKTDNILSYYDIPSMNKNTKIMSESNSFSDDDESNILSKTDDLPKNLPVIKNIEKVNFDLNDIKKMHKINDINQPAIENSNLQKSTNNATNNATTHKYAPSLLHSFKPTFHTNSRLLKTKYYNCSDKKNSNDKKIHSENQIHSTLANFDSYRLSQGGDNAESSMTYNQYSTFNYQKSRDSSEEVSKDCKLTFPFGFENPTMETPKVIQNKFSTISLPIPSNSDKKYSYNTQEGSSSLLSRKTFEKNHDLMSEHSGQVHKCYNNNEIAKNVSSLSLFSNKKQDQSWLFHELKTTDSIQIYEPLIEPKNSYKCNKETHKNAFGNQPQSSFIHLIENRESNISQNQSPTQTFQKFNIDENPDNLFNVSQISVSTLDKFEGSINRKLLQKCKYSINICNSLRELKNSEELMSEKQTSVCNEYEYNQEMGIESQNSLSILETYKQNLNTNKITSVSPLNTKYINVNNSDHINAVSCNEKDLRKTELLILMDTANSKPRKPSKTLLPGILEFYNQLQNEGTSEPVCLKTDQQQEGDFLSILSQSSNESNSIDYESYKNAFTEALTFN